MSFSVIHGAKVDLRSFDWFYLWRQMHDEKQTLKGHADSVKSVSFSPDGRTLASGSSDKTVKLWDVVSGKELRKLEGHTDFVRSVSFSPDGRTLASGGSGGRSAENDPASNLLLWRGATDDQVARQCIRCGGKE